MRYNREHYSKLSFDHEHGTLVRWEHPANVDAFLDASSVSPLEKEIFGMIMKANARVLIVLQLLATSVKKELKEWKRRNK